MIDDYLDAKKLGDWAYRRAVLFGQYPYLPALDDIILPEDIQGENQLGLMEIPLSDIVGTKTSGRQQAFASNFMPLLGPKTEFAGKWSSLYESAAEEGIRDPILVYEYMHKFYVQEGNKRVSVMKRNGAVSIPAYVTRILPKRTEEKENRIYYEFVEFFKWARIYRITFSESGSYDRLMQVLGKKPGEPWTEEFSRDVRAAYDRFRELYLERGGEKLEITAGDAFLLYLNVYGLGGIQDRATGEIRSNIEKLWNEFLKSAGEVTLVKAPEELRRDVGLLDFLTDGGKDTKREPLKIAFLYDSGIQDSGWCYGHELGRSYLEEKLGERVQTRKFEFCNTAEKIRDAIEEAAAEKTGLIFTTAELMVEESVKAALRYPELIIMNCSVNTSYNSIRTYYGRMYEAKFLMGALAASLTEGNDLGYVELCPLYGTIANVNAFAIGAQLVNPWARVHLRWSGREGEDWKCYFRERSIDMISGPELVRPRTPSREFGLYLVSDGEVISNAAMPVFDWGKYYEIIVHSVMEGSFSGSRLAKSHQALNYWFGMSAGVIDVILSRELKYSSGKLMALLKEEILHDRLSPFDGELHSQAGLVKGADSERLRDEEIVGMRWLNDNVIGEIPALSEFSERAQELIRKGGFLS